MIILLGKTYHSAFDYYLTDEHDSILKTFF